MKITVNVSTLVSHLSKIEKNLQQKSEREAEINLEFLKDQRNMVRKIAKDHIRFWAKWFPWNWGNHNFAARRRWFQKTMMEIYYVDGYCLDAPTPISDKYKMVKALQQKIQQIRFLEAENTLILEEPDIEIIRGIDEKI